MTNLLLSILAGILLSWLQLEGLRRDVRKLLRSERMVRQFTDEPMSERAETAEGGLVNAGRRGRRWPTLFLLRWSALALAVWACLHLFKQNLLPFLISFIMSGFLLRVIYRRKTYAS